MKKILFLTFLVLTNFVNAQKPDTVTYEFCLVMALSKGLSDVDDGLEVNLFLDFGTGVVYTPSEPYKDPVTKFPILMESVASVLTYLSEKKWIFVATNSYNARGQSVNER
jgi:hypothetical protein